MPFNVNDSVRIVRVGQDRLDNATGVVLGPTMESMTPDGYYIVLLDVPLPDRRAIVITEHCLESTQLRTTWAANHSPKPL